MKAFVNHLAYDFRSVGRDKGRLLLFHLFPLVFFVLCGFFMTAVNPFYREVMLPGMVLFAVMSASLLAGPQALVQARENGVFRSFRINGVPSAAILSIPVISAALHLAATAAVISLAGVFAFGGRAPSSAVGFAAAVLISYTAYAALGVLIGVAADKDASATLATQLIFVPSILLGGLMVPARILPHGLQRVTLLMPSTHCMNVFAGLAGLGGGASAGIPWASLLVLGSSVVLCFGLAAVLFEWDSRTNRPSRKTYAALLAIVPYVWAACAGL